MFVSPCRNRELIREVSAASPSWANSWSETGMTNPPPNTKRLADGVICMLENLFARGGCRSRDLKSCPCEPDSCCDRNCSSNDAISNCCVIRRSSLAASKAHRLTSRVASDTFRLASRVACRAVLSTSRVACRAMLSASRVACREFSCLSS